MNQDVDKRTDNETEDAGKTGDAERRSGLSRIRAYLCLCLPRDSGERPVVGRPPSTVAVRRPTSRAGQG